PAYELSDHNFAPSGELLFELKAGHQLSELKSLINLYQLDIKRAFHPEAADQTELDDFYLVDIPNDKVQHLNAIYRAFDTSNLVDWVEGNETVQLDDPQQDLLPSRTKRSYGLNDPGVNQLWAFDEMRMDQLYQVLADKKAKAQKKARIFILDTGVDAQHEDLQANYRSVKKRYDKDVAGHGTHCAGIAAAVSNNNKGIASFSLDNQYVEVSSIKVLSDFGSGTQSSIINGMIEAADKGADVISMSLGGRSNASRRRAYAQAVAYANKKGAIVICAAGNSNMNAKDYAPANTPGVITVSALDTSLNRASFSNMVQDVEMGIAAPGVAIYSCYPKSKYATFNGTSMATPYVAGLVGLMKSIQPDLDTKTAHELLKKTGKKTSAGVQTGKFIQPAKAVKRLLE
ncbi:MAG: S8 family serine peptidase, partial [Bacteroidota bacterium]